MTDLPSNAHPENTYVLGSENTTEMARLIDQDQQATESLGELLPSDVVLAPGACVLDVACGPGGWVQEMAFTYPEVEVTGIDISNMMIQYARAQASVQDLTNAYFQVMDASQPLQFSDQYFDIVNMRFALGFMLPHNWPSFIQDVVRITKPGGTIRLTESEGFGVTTSPAFERLNDYSLQAMHLAGRTFHPSGRTIGITPMLRHFLWEAGCQNIRTRLYGLDFSAGTKAHHSTCQNFFMALQLLKSFLIQTGKTTDEEFEQLLEQARREMYEPGFSGLTFGATVWGSTPS